MSAGSPAPGVPLRLVLVGAGVMGRNWLRAIAAAKCAELVGVVDLDVDLAIRAVAAEQLRGVVTGSDLPAVAVPSEAQAVVNVTVPHAHHAVSTAALYLGLPVLTEKPVAPTVAEALSLAAASEVTGTLLMVSQSRRYFNALREFRELADAVGPTGILSTQFFRAPRFGGFRDEMDEPLLVDMAIHAFDAARYLLDDEPVAVTCGSFNPSWSWYQGSAAADATFTFRRGARYSYLGSWCSPGLETTWNGEWRASGAGGTALWDGGSVLRAATASGAPPDGMPVSGRPEEIEGALAEFADAVREGRVPSGEVHSNVMSLAMVEAAVRASGARREIAIEEVFDEALTLAIRQEKREDVRRRLAERGTALWRAGKSAGPVPSEVPSKGCSRGRCR